MHKKIKTTITLSSHIKEFASKEAAALGLDFSAYITVLIAEKLRGTILVQNGTPYNKHDTITDEVSVSVASEEIDTSQLDELDRLLSLNDL